MNNLHILDCTLRDGGYCNEWRFGFDNAKKIVSGLVEANVEIIECGFLTQKITKYNPEITRFQTVEQLAAIIPKNREGKLFVAMMNYVTLGIAISFVGPIIAAEVMKKSKWLEFFLYPGKFIK